MLELQVEVALKANPYHPSPLKLLEMLSDFTVQ